jgi:hypothetical protein
MTNKCLLAGVLLMTACRLPAPALMVGKLERGPVRSDTYTGLKTRLKVKRKKEGYVRQDKQVK